MHRKKLERLVTVCCPMAALLVVVAMLAGQHRATRLATAPSPTLPITGGEPAQQGDRLGLLERLRLRRSVEDRYQALGEITDMLTAEQQQMLAEVAGLLEN